MPGPTPRRWQAVLAVALLLAGCGDSDDAATTTTTEPATSSTTGAGLTDESVIHARGLGPVTAGLTVHEAEAAGKVTLDVVDDEVQDFEGFCYHATPESLDGVTFMVTNENPPDDPKDGRIARVSVYGQSDDEEQVAAAKRWQTDAGLHVGSTEADVRAAYPAQRRLRDEAHEYVEGGRYLTVEPAGDDDEGFGIKYVIVDGTVDEIHAGDADAIGYVEGCA